MKNCKGIIGVIFLSLCLTLIAPNVMPTQNISTVEAAKVKLSKTKATLIKKQTLQLEVKNSTKKVTWSTSDKFIATVNKNGKVTAKKAGSTTITATVNSNTYTCNIIVEEPKISQSSLSLIKGASTIVNVQDTTQKIKWTSSNKSIVTVNNSGKITAKKNGKATITAAIGTKKYNCKVTVKNISNSTLSKNVSYEAYEAPKNLIVKFTNNNDINIDGYFVVVYYDANGNMLYTDSFFDNYFNVIEPGKNQIAYFSYPIDKYSSFKIIVSATSVNAIGMSDKIKISSSSSSNGVIANLTNTSNKTMTVTYIYVLYYNNNKVVGFDWSNIYDFKGGASKYLQFISPYDENYNDLPFDRYEMFVCDTFRDK